MAVLGHVGYHRLERLRMAVVVMLIYEHDAPEAAQVVERLLERQPEAPSKLQYEDERPLQFIVIAVSHNRCVLLVVSSAKVRIYFELRRKDTKLSAIHIITG